MSKPKTSKSRRGKRNRKEEKESFLPPKKLHSTHQTLNLYEYIVRDVDNVPYEWIICTIKRRKSSSKVTVCPYHGQNLPIPCYVDGVSDDAIIDNEVVDTDNVSVMRFSYHFHPCIGDQVEGLWRATPRSVVAFYPGTVININKERDEVLVKWLGNAPGYGKQNWVSRETLRRQH